MTSDDLVVTTHNEEETRDLGALLGALLRPGDVVALVGPLAAGKTRFVQGIARGMGIRRPVTSPTFILMNVYQAADGRILCHVDCYRLNDPVEEGYQMGLDEQVRGENVCAIEWAERVRPLLPEDVLWVEFQPGDGNVRRLHFRARGPRGRERLQELKAALSAS